MRRRPPSPVVNVRSAERRFLDEFLVMLADGFKMRKHGRRGGPKDRLVRLDGDMIVWTRWKSKFRRVDLHAIDATLLGHEGVDGVRPSFGCPSAGGIPVADVTEVRRTFAGRPRPSNVAEDRCLSLISKARAVDLELPDNEVRELCHDGFSLLVKFGAPVTSSPLAAAATSTQPHAIEQGVDPLGRPRTPPRHRPERIPSIDHDME